MTVSSSLPRFSFFAAAARLARPPALALLLVLGVLGPLRAEAPVLELKLLNVRDHSPEAYTQGLFIRQGRLYESSGLYGRSTFTEWRGLQEGRMRKIRSWALPDRFFAEGAAWAEDEIYLLTWREETGFVLDPENLAVKRRFAYEGEGWGLAWDGKTLWRSDGSSRLRPHRPGDFAPAGEPLTVRDGEREVENLNELEWCPRTGLLLANVYGQDLAAAVGLDDGRVRFWLDGRPLRRLARAHGLASAGSAWDTVLNGLALNGDRLWLTGKLWPRLYQAQWPPEGWESLK